MALKPIDVYAILKKKIKNGSGSGLIFDEDIYINENGEIEVSATIGNIYIDMTDAYLKTTINNIFSVNEDGYLISSK